MRTWRRWILPGLAALALLVVAAVAFGYLAAPGLIRSQALKTLDETYHRQARLDRVRLDPLALRVEVDGFSLPDRDGRPMVGFRSLTAAVSPSSLWSGHLVLTEITLDRPAVRAVRHADGTINLADLTPRSAKPKEPQKPFRLRIDHFHVRDGEATLVDQMGGTPIERRLFKVAFSLADFST